MGKKKAAREAEKAEKREMKKERRRRRRRKALIGMTISGGAMLIIQLIRAQSQKAKQRVTPGSGTVTQKDEEPNGLSSMLGQLLEAFLKEPAKKAIADTMNVAVSIQDITNPDLATTIRFKGSDVMVENGVAPDTQIYIGTELELLLALSGAGKGAEMLKFLQTEEGKNLIKAFREGRFKVKGAVTHLGQMMKFQSLLTPSE